MSNKQKGIGLLELMLSLAVIAIMLVMAITYFIVTNRSRDVTEAVRTLTVIKSAADHWALVNNNYSNASFKAFVDRNWLPSEYANNPTNPWGGNISISAQNASSLTILLTGIPMVACNDLKNKVGLLVCSSTSDVSGCSGESSSLSVTFKTSCS